MGVVHSVSLFPSLSISLTLSLPLSLYRLLRYFAHTHNIIQIYIYPKTQQNRRLKAQIITIRRDLEVLDKAGGSDVVSLRENFSERERELEKTKETLINNKQSWKVEQAKLEQAKFYLEQRAKALQETLMKVIAEMEELEGKYLELKGAGNKELTMYKQPSNGDVEVKAKCINTELTFEVQHKKLYRGTSAVGGATLDTTRRIRNVATEKTKRKKSLGRKSSKG